jgi:hypothetical protein
MKRHKLLVEAAIVAVCTLAAAQVPSAAPACQDPKDYRIVASREVRGGKQSVAVDPDGRVLLLFQRAAKTDIEPLGYEQSLPSDFPYASLMPKDEALTMLRRVSCASQKWRIWIAVTTGFAPQKALIPGSVPLSNRLMIFREPAEPNAKPLLLDESFGEVFDLTVDDINDDQHTEIAAQYTDDNGEWMKIWQIGDNGLLHLIPLDNIKKDLNAGPGHVEIGLGDYRHGGELLYTEQRVQTAKGWHVTRRFYDWDDAHQRYQLSEMVQSDEITLK